MIVSYLRFWIWASCLVHAVLLAVLLSLPTPPHMSDDALIHFETLAASQTAAPPEKVLPDKVQPAPERERPTPPERETRPTPATRLPMMPVPHNTVVRPGPTRMASALHPTAPSLLPNGGPQGSPRDPQERPGGGTGFENGIRNLPGVPVETTLPDRGGWSERPGAGGAPGFGLSGPGKISPRMPGGGSGTDRPGPVGNAGALHPGMPSGGYAGTRGGVGGGSTGGFSPNGGGGNLTFGDGGIGTLAGAGPSVVGGHSGQWSERPGGGGFGNGSHGGGTGLASIGPGHGYGRGHGGGGTSLNGPVGHGTGLRPGAGIGSGPGREGFGGGGGGYDGHGLPGAGGDPLGSDINKFPIASSGGPKGHGGSWGDGPGGGGGIGGNGSNLLPSGPSYGAKVVSGPVPIYPALAKKENQHGMVILSVTTNGSGQVVGEVKIVKHSSSDALDNAAKNALQQWRYRAAMRNGERVTDTIKVSVDFEPGKTPEVKQL